MLKQIGNDMRISYIHFFKNIMYNICNQKVIIGTQVVFRRSQAGKETKEKTRFNTKVQF